MPIDANIPLSFKSPDTDGAINAFYQAKRSRQMDDALKMEQDAAQAKQSADLKREHLAAAAGYAQKWAATPNLTKDIIKADLDGAAQSGEFDENTYKQQLAMLPSLPDDPQGLADWSKSMVAKTLKSHELMGFLSPTANAQLQADTSRYGTDTNAETARRGQDFSRENNMANLGLNRDRMLQDRELRGRGLDIQEANNQFNNELNLKKYNNPQAVGNIPAGIKNAYAQNNVSLGKIDQALGLVGKNPDAFGLKNMMGDTVMQRYDPKGVDARALIADIGSLKIHDRSGAAVTAAESPRLKPFIPNATDTPEVITKKLNNFKREYLAMQREMEALTPGLGNNGGATGSLGAPQGIDPGEWEQFMQEMGQ